MGIHRAMVVLENVSGLSEDRFVNTFHFGAGDLGSAIVPALRDFYNAGTGGGIAQFISPNVSRTPGKCRIKVYDLADAKPREALTDEALDLNAAGSTVALPNELAVCLSFYADRSLPRQRGRVYLGPLTTAVLEQASSPAPDELVSGTFISYVISAATALKDAAGLDWLVYSPTDGVGRSVTAGWCDKAWDIQRRRGAKPTTRFIF